jgi:adenosylcobinamide kinase/adenosylcobinamide-phosphate guanylyltransferase
MGAITLVLGGARSGKSRFAQALASQAGGRVLYVATLEPLDTEMRDRVEAHRRSRPADWPTIEEPLDPVGALSRHGPYEVCLFDCLTLWLSNLLLQEGVDTSHDWVSGEVEKLIAWQKDQPAALIVVSNDVGSGIVPDNELARRYRDLLGEANQAVANAAGNVYLCVAGYALDIKQAGVEIPRSTM